MPTIQQLPPADTVDAADELPVSQAGVTRAVTIGTLLSTTQPAILAPTGALLGRISIGDGGPEAIIVGNGLELSSGTLTAAGFIGAVQTGTISSDDLVYISQNGSNRTITLADFLEGETIDQGQVASPASDSDSFWVGQGSSTMLVQSFSALWTWVLGHLPGWKRTVVEIGTTTQLDGSIHNNAILICSQPVTINPAFSTQGNGFTCTIINASSGMVTLGSGFTTSSGTASIPVGQVGHVTAGTYSGGSLNFVEISGTGATLIAPGQTTGLTVVSSTPTSVTLSWAAPASGGMPSTYTVQWRVTSVGGAWTGSSNTSSIGFTASGLTASTEYDFEVIAVNAGGSGPASSVVSGSTGVVASYAPNVPTSVVVGATTSSTAPVSWTAPMQDGTHGAATSYTVQWRIAGTSSWTQQSGISGTNYTISGLSAATEYDVQIQAVNGSGDSAFTGTASATTQAVSAGNYAMGSGFLPYSGGTSYPHSSSTQANVSDLSTSQDGGYTVPAEVYFGWNTSPTVPPSSLAGLTQAAGNYINSGNQYWYSFAVPTPSSPGTYYFWSVETDGSGNIVASVPQHDSVLTGGNVVAFTIT